MTKKLSNSAARTKLTAAVGSGVLWRIDRTPRFADRIDGFVLALGTKWVLLAQTSAGGHSDGLVALRIGDVRAMSRDRSFAAQFAKQQPDWPRMEPEGVELDSTEKVLRSLALLAPLVGLEKEHERKAMWVGVVRRFERKWVQFFEVRPNAKWYDEALWYRLKAVTSITIGSSYLTALATIAGAPPPEEG